MFRVHKQALSNLTMRVLARHGFFHFHLLAKGGLSLPLIGTVEVEKVHGQKTRTPDATCVSRWHFFK
jgi:hypothetical protein